MKNKSPFFLMYICLYIKYSLKDIHQIANCSFLLLELSVFIFSFCSCNFLIHLQQVFIICIKKKKLKILLKELYIWKVSETRRANRRDFFKQDHWPRVRIQCRGVSSVGVPERFRGMITERLLDLITGIVH